MFSSLCLVFLTYISAEPLIKEKPKSEQIQQPINEKVANATEDYKDNMPANIREAWQHRYELKCIKGKCERVANGGVFRSAYTIGHMRLPEQIKIQCFKNASLLYMLDCTVIQTVPT